MDIYPIIEKVLPNFLSSWFEAQKSFYSDQTQRKRLAFGILLGPKLAAEGQTTHGMD